MALVVTGCRRSSSVQTSGVVFCAYDVESDQWHEEGISAQNGGGVGAAA